MNILFVHQNFPGQFKHLAPALGATGQHRVVALHMNPTRPLPGVETIAVRPARKSTPNIHPWVGDFEAKVIRGEATFRRARELQAAGFEPDVIVAHPGWGESLFLQDLWPKAAIGLYCEFYYRSTGADVNFDPEFPSEPDAAPRLRVKNAFYEMQLPCMKGGVSPTHWQRSTFPERFRDLISVIHDGIDTDHVRPAAGVRVQLSKADTTLGLTDQDEVVTFVVRNLEPYRGYHSFMRALPAIMRRRPNAHVLIVGGDGVSYGARPPPAPGGAAQQGWKKIFLDEVAGALDLERLHFLGTVAYADFLRILQISSTHVYLTYPFVLSWSLLEAMSAGCAIVASDTVPVREAITHGETGVLVDFFDVGALADAVIAMLDDAGARRRLGAAARQCAIDRYDLRRVCLPAQLEWVGSLR